MKNIVIIGAGDLGKEAVWLIEDINKKQPTYLVLGFLDDDRDKKGMVTGGYRVLGTTDDLEQMNTGNPFCAVVAIQDGETRKKIVEGHKGFDKWESIIHPTAAVSSTAFLGAGSIVFPQVTVSVDSRLGTHGLFYSHSVICNDCILEDYVSLMSGVSVAEHVEIGEGSYLASGCRVYPHTRLGKNVRVAVGATVNKDYTDNAEIGEKGKSFFFK